MKETAICKLDKVMNGVVIRQTQIHANCSQTGLLPWQRSKRTINSPQIVLYWDVSE